MYPSAYLIRKERPVKEMRFPNAVPGDSALKKIDIIFGLFAQVASVVVFVVGSANYNTSNSSVE